MPTLRIMAHGPLERCDQQISHKIRYSLREKQKTVCMPMSMQTGKAFRDLDIYAATHGISSSYRSSVSLCTDDVPTLSSRSAFCLAHSVVGNSNL